MGHPFLHVVGSGLIVWVGVPEGGRFVVVITQTLILEESGDEVLHVPLLVTRNLFLTGRKDIGSVLPSSLAVRAVL